MPSITIKELHMARSFEELQKKAELPKPFDTKVDVTRLINICEKLQSAAKDALRSGDQEQAYILFHRFMTTFNYVKKEDQGRFLAKISRDQIEACLKHFETLQDKLQQRYAEKQKSLEDRRAQLFNTPNTPLPGTSVKVDTTNGFDQDVEDDKEDEYACMKPLQLVDSIQRSSQLSKVLLIDIRSAEEFAQSCISANKFKATGEVNIINIPSNIIEPGLTFSALSRKVNFGLVKDALERRRSMDTVVIMDRATAHFEKESKCVLLAMALFKWDQSPECVKRKPVLLTGGFNGFALAYPTFLTNSDVINHINNAPISLKMEPIKKGLYDFYEENNAEEEKKKQNEATNNGSKLQPATLNGFTSSSESGQVNRFTFNSRGFTSFGNSPAPTNNNTFGLSSKVPGTAKPIPIIPDRSAKPKLDVHNKLNDDNEVSMKDNEVDSADQEMTSPRPAASSSSNGFLSNATSTTSKVINIKKPLNDPSLLRTTLPPKPEHLVSPLTTNGHSSAGSSSSLLTSRGLNGVSRLVENGTTATTNRHMEVDDDDDDFVAGNFDDDLNSRKVPFSVLQTPVHRRNEAKFNLTDENMSEEEEEEEEEEVVDEVMDDDGGERPSSASRSKPISMARPSNGTSNFSAPGSLSRSLSSPNIAQFDESQQFSFSPGTGTPKMQHPIYDRSMKPMPYTALLRKPRDFSPQYSSCARIPGLRNLGNTCFMNSILQCLNNTTELSEHLRSGSVHINPNSKFGSNGELTIELMELLKQMQFPSNFKHISPKDMKSAVIRHIPDFVEYKQQDAHEFLVRFLDRVHADLNRRSQANVDDPVMKDPNYYDKLSLATAVNRFWTLHLERNKSIITELFEGLIVSTITCLHCSYTSRALEAFTCLTLPIQEGGRTSINTSLKMFLRQERISDETAWQCPTCKQKRDAEKCTYIWKLPKVLVIHLKRFSYDGMWRQKISTFVDFPIDNLLVESRDEMNRSYSLYGVVNHSGSLEGGHYIAFSRNLELNIGWQRYDDQDVSAVSPSEVITQNAYVLFYKQTKN